MRHTRDFFPVAEFKCKVLQWQAQSDKVQKIERERIHSVASALIALSHCPRALCSRLLPGEVVHHLYEPKDLICFWPRPADWDALWQACFLAGITRFRGPLCREHLGVWKAARAALQKGLAARQFLPDQVAELLAHDPEQPQRQRSGVPQPAADPAEQDCVHNVHKHLCGVGLQEDGVSAAIMFVPRQRVAIQRSHAIRRFLETMPPEKRPHLDQNMLRAGEDLHISWCKTDLTKVLKGIKEELRSHSLPSKNVSLETCIQALESSRSPDDGFRMLLEDRPAEAAKATTAPAAWAQVEDERTELQSKQKSALHSGVFQPAADDSVVQAAEIRAMHCNDLDLDLPTSRSEQVILRSAKLCLQLTDGGLSHPAVQNPHASTQLCWLCRQLGRAQTLKHGLRERCDRVRVGRGPRTVQLVPSNAFHPHHRECMCGGFDGTHVCSFGFPSTNTWKATKSLQNKLEADLCYSYDFTSIGLPLKMFPNGRRSLNLPLDDCSADPEWDEALREALWEKKRGEWTRKLCLEGMCSGRCEKVCEWGSWRRGKWLPRYQ